MVRMPRVGSLAGIVGAIAAVLVLIVVLSAVHLLPQLRNPFAETTTVRSQPVILKSITNLSRYEAASGSFQVVVDLSQRSLLPSFLQGSETLFIGLYRVTGLGKCVAGSRDPIYDDDVSGMNRYDLAYDDALAQYVERLSIDWGPGARAWVQASATRRPLRTDRGHPRRMHAPR